MKRRGPCMSIQWDLKCRVQYCGSCLVSSPQGQLVILHSVRYYPSFAPTAASDCDACPVERLRLEGETRRGLWKACPTVACREMMIGLNLRRAADSSSSAQTAAEWRLHQAGPTARKPPEAPGISCCCACS